MDLSSVQSSGKCGSDFSIERILSEDTRGREENGQAPSWLCCTRYQPPRLPRAPNACRSRRSGRHARVPFTGAQAAALEAAYARAPYLAPPALRALASALQLRDDRIKIWFQNRRARERREKSGTITPPHAVALPSTASLQKQNFNDAWSLQNPGYLYEAVNSLPETTDNLSNLSNNKYFNQSLSTDDSNESRCDSPIDVESIVG